MGEVRNAAITLSNSIIGVAILAMPYCYAQCGFVLATALLALAALGTIQSCQMLLKAALATKKRSYEFLAHHVYGQLGKLAVELSLIGLSIGTLVAFFVIIGDICPQVLASLLGIPSLADAPGCRPVVMATISICVILPLSLIRDPSALAKTSAASLLFYLLFLLHLAGLALFSEPTRSSDGAPTAAAYRLVRFEGLLYCLPIFGLAFSCQTQVFLLCDSLRDPSIKVVRRVLLLSVLGCCLFYVLVGVLGYVAFNSAYPEIHGDLMTMYPGTLASDVVKLGFVLSVAVSFPVIVFPCRVSIYSFVYLQHHRAVGGSSDLSSGRVFIPVASFRCITSVIVFGTLVGGILIPNVEFILNLTGAVTGSVICYILPAGIHLRSGGSSKRKVARAIKWLGVLTMCVGTAATLFGTRGAAELPNPAARLSLPALTARPPVVIGVTAADTSVVTSGPLRSAQAQPAQADEADAAAAVERQLPRRRADTAAPGPTWIGPPSELKDSESRKEPPLPKLPPDDDVDRPDRRRRGMKGDGQQPPSMPPRLTRQVAHPRDDDNAPTSTASPAAVESTSTAAASSNSTSRKSAAAPAATAAAAAPPAADLAVLAQLLREQREQGRRIEAQLRRIEERSGLRLQQAGRALGNDTTVSSNATLAPVTSAGAGRHINTTAAITTATNATNASTINTKAAATTGVHKPTTVSRQEEHNNSTVKPATSPNPLPAKGNKTSVGSV